MTEKPMSMLEALKDPANQWQVMATLLLNSLPQVSLPETGPIPSIPKWLRRLTEDELRQADEHCRKFCADWKWPDVQGPIRYQLFFRALCASEYAAAQGYHKAAPPPDVIPWPETMPQLLIDLWNKHRHLWATNRHPPGGAAFRKPLHQAFDTSPVN